MTVLDEDGITELEKFTPERVDGVDLPANGSSFLMLKALGGAEPAPESTGKAVGPVGAPQDEDVAKDWAAWDAAHPGSHRAGQGSGAAPAKNPKDPGTSQADASAAWAHAHGTLAEEHAGGKPSAADLENAHDVHVAHEEHEAHLAAEGKKPAAPKPKAKAKTAAKPKAAVKPKAAAKKSTVTVELPADVSVSFTPSDLAKLTKLKRQLAEQEEAAKRDMDPDVGGGTDRDKIPGEDFAGPHRSFPIVKPGDVSDAASSIGQAAPEDRAKVKANIIAIAHRKGPAHVDQLPDAWKDGDDAKGAAKAGGPAKGGKPFPGAAPPFKAKAKDDDAGDAGGSDDDDDDGDDADDDDDDDDGDGAEKSGRGCECGTALAKDAKFCPQCGKPAMAKARACKCGTTLAKDHKFCAQCGAQAPGAAEKGKVPSPQDAAVAGAVSQAKEAVRDAISAQGDDPDKDSHPADAKVSAHLDEAKHAIGNAEDAQEEDIKTDDPAAHAAKAAAAEGPAYHLRRLHDATCAAYRHDDVVIAHPSAAKGIGELADPRPFASMVSAALADDAGTGSRAHEIPALSAVYHHAVTLKALAAQPGVLDGAMNGLRKAFAEYYPDAHPQPGSVTPGQFKRPYISAGHAGQSAAPGQEPRVPLAANVPSPSDFQRPLITDGREAGSPGSNPAPAGAQKAGGRTYYTNAGKDGASQALTAMHDWIAGNHPGICPMTGAAADGDPGRPGSASSSPATARPAPQQFAAARDKAVPVPVTPAAAHAAVTPSVTKAERKAAAKAARKAENMAGQAAETAPADASASPLIDPELLKSALREAVAEQLAELLPGVVTKATGALEQRVAEMESAPDPAQMTPRSGTAVKKNANAGPEVPDSGDGHAVERLTRLLKRAKDPDSNVRAVAIGELIDTAGREAAAQLLEAAY
jgi:hypothetical protein